MSVTLYDSVDDLVWSEEGIDFLKKANKTFKDASAQFYDEIDMETVCVIQREIQARRCDGSTIYFSGVGKSANIASHISDMLKSIGFKAVTLDPVLALHGDSGMVRDTDMVICFSKSGNTEELLNLVMCLRQRKSCCKIISVTCSPKGKLRRASKSDTSICLPQREEVDPGWNLVPTVSSQFFLNFGNLLVSGILLEENYDLKDYSQSHPGGSIGNASRSMSDGKKIIEHKGPLAKVNEKDEDEESLTSANGLADKLKNVGVLKVPEEIRKTILTTIPEKVRKSVTDFDAAEPAATLLAQEFGSNSNNDSQCGEEEVKPSLVEASRPQGVKEIQ